MKKNQLRVDILGTSFSIQSGENPEYLKSLYDHLKRKISDAKQDTRVSDPLKIAILACLNCIDELFKEKERGIRASRDAGPAVDERIINEEIDEVTERIMRKIDESLSRE
jgi:cell division protein ZapA (FtsZ GTPase activity inhibitor)